MEARWAIANIKRRITIIGSIVIVVDIKWQLGTGKGEHTYTTNPARRTAPQMPAIKARSGLTDATVTVPTNNRMVTMEIYLHMQNRKMCVALSKNHELLAFTRQLLRGAQLCVLECTKN